MVPDAIDNINLDEEFSQQETGFGKVKMDGNETIGLNNLTIGGAP